MPKSHAPYPQSFRGDAVALVRTGGKSIAEVAVDLGVSNESLRKWVQQAKVDAGEGPPTTDSVQRRRTAAGRGLALVWLRGRLPWYGRVGFAGSLAGRLPASAVPHACGPRGVPRVGCCAPTASPHLVRVLGW
jgi:transposase